MAAHRCVRRACATAVASLLAAGALPAAAAPAVTHTITIEAMRFEPATLVVSAGDVIVWVNRDPFPHTVASRAGRFGSPEIAPGGSWRHTVQARGALPYRCTLHPTMRGELRVH